jgi:hypothetical protein
MTSEEEKDLRLQNLACRARQERHRLKSVTKEIRKEISLLENDLETIEEFRSHLGALISLLEDGGSLGYRSTLELSLRLLRRSRERNSGSIDMELIRETLGVL